MALIKCGQLCSSLVMCSRPVSRVSLLALQDRMTSARVSGSRKNMTKQVANATMPCHQKTQRHPRESLATVQAETAEPMACDARTVRTKKDIGRERPFFGHKSATKLCVQATARTVESSVTQSISLWQSPGNSRVLTLQPWCYRQTPSVLGRYVAG